jgi:hypothetical protein
MRPKCSLGRILVKGIFFAARRPNDHVSSVMSGAKGEGRLDLLGCTG